MLAADTDETVIVARRVKVGRSVRVDQIRIKVLEISGNEVRLQLDGATLVEMLPAETRPRRQRFGRVD